MEKDQIHWNATWKKGIGKVNIFARKTAKRIGKKKTELLDIGCGTGKDSLYFATKGYSVTAFDFSSEALKWLQSIALKQGLSNIKTVEGDTSKPLPFANASFDVVYAHLSLHYFDTPTTQAVFRDIHRILKPSGLFFVKCKSEKDSLFGKGRKIAEDMYIHEHVRHFFRKEFLTEMLHDFKILRLRRTSSTYTKYKSSFVEADAVKPA